MPRRAAKQPETQREAAAAISAIMHRIQRQAMGAQAIARRFWVVNSPIGRCAPRIYDYAKELEKYMEQFK